MSLFSIIKLFLKLDVFIFKTFICECFACVYVCMCIMFMPGVHGGQKRASAPLTLKVWLVDLGPL